MTLSVSLEDFTDALSRHGLDPVAYIEASGTGALVSASDPGQGILIQATSKLSLDATQSVLESHQVTVYRGRWSLDGESEPACVPTVPHVGAVAYISSGQAAGLWVDAFPQSVTEHEVLESMYEDFKSSGEIASASFEEFAKAVTANIVILSPGELEAFALKHENT